MKKLLSIFILLSLIISNIVLLKTPVSADNVNDTYSFEGTINITDDTNENCIPFEEITIEIPIPQKNYDKNISTNSDVKVEVFILKGGLKKYSNGIFTWSFNIDCPSSPIIKPTITVNLILECDVTTGKGLFYTSATYTKTLNSNFDYGTTYTFTTNSKTGYYRYKYSISLPGEELPTYKTTETILYNRTGNKWDFYFTDGLGKELLPPRANWIKYSLHTRPSNLADTYYKQYEALNGIVLDRSLYDVHHIQPLAHCGTNDYDNLIHLPKDLHTKVSGWFNGY